MGAKINHQLRHVSYYKKKKKSTAQGPLKTQSGGPKSEPDEEGVICMLCKTLNTLRFGCNPELLRLIDSLKSR